MKMGKFYRRKKPCKPLSAKFIMVLMVLVTLIFLVNQAIAVFPETSLVNYWDFNDGINDSFGRLNLTNGGTTNVTGFSSSGRAFDGIGDYLSLGNIANMENGTLNAWVFKNESQARDYIIVNSGGTVNGAVAIIAGRGDNGDVPKIELYAGGTWQETDGTNMFENQTWQMATFVWNATGSWIYVNGTLEVAKIAGNDGVFDAAISHRFGSTGGDETVSLNGTLDDIGLWNRTLTTTEIGDLWNAGLGSFFSIVTTNLSVDLVEPTNNSARTTDDVIFNATFTPKSVNLTNMTLHVWYTNSTLFATNTTALNGNLTMDNSSTISNWTVGDFLWNYKSCYENSTTGVFIDCSWAANNFSLTWRPFTVSSSQYNTTAIETSLQQFRINISTATGFDLQNARLVYNGTEYTNVIKTSLGGGNYTLSRNITIPTGVVGFTEENRTFYWNVSIVNEDTGVTSSQLSDFYNQTVRELDFGLCSAVINIPLLNFTLIDEVNGSEINGASNATTFQGTFRYGLSSVGQLKNYSINNITTALTKFDFCTKNYTAPIFTDLALFYTAVDYVDKNYVLTNASLDNVTNEINLYLLEETQALEFFMSVQQSFGPLTNATINVDKFFVGEGVYKTVEIDVTDSDGEFTAFLDLDKEYRFTITKEGSVLAVLNKRATCSAAPCEIVLNIPDEVEDPFTVFETSFAGNVLYNLSFDPLTKIVTFDFIDTTGLATYFRMVIYQTRTNQSGTPIYDNSLFTSSGSMSFDASAYTGDFRVEVYVSRSPESFIDFITFLISDTAEALGVLGLFSAFLLVMVIIFGLSFKPSVLVMAVPLSLTIAKLAGLVSLSVTSLVFVFVLAIIATLVMSK